MCSCLPGSAELGPSCVPYLQCNHHTGLAGFRFGAMPCPSQKLMTRVQRRTVFVPVPPHLVPQAGRHCHQPMWCRWPEGDLGRGQHRRCQLLDHAIRQKSVLPQLHIQALLKDTSIIKAKMRSAQLSPGRLPAKLLQTLLPSENRDTNQVWRWMSFTTCLRASGAPACASIPPSCTVCMICLASRRRQVQSDGTAS